MKNVIAGAIAVALLATPAYAAKAFFVREYKVDWQSKNCVYKYLGQEYIITIRLLSPCPYSIEV